MSIWAHISCTYRRKQYRPPLLSRLRTFLHMALTTFSSWFTFFYFFAQLIYHKQYLPNQISFYLFYLSFLLILLGLLVVIYTVFVEPAARSWVDFFFTFFWDILFGIFFFYILHSSRSLPLTLTYFLLQSVLFAVNKLAMQTSLTFHFAVMPSEIIRIL